MGVSLAVLTLCATLAGCGSDADASADVAVVAAEPLSAAELEQAVLTKADLGGYDIEKVVTDTSASRRTADPAECAPVARALGGSSGFGAVARAGRMIFSKKDSATGATMILSSHSGQGAARVIAELRTAAEECETFKDVAVGFRYDDVEVRPDPHQGDESVSLRLTQLAALSEDEEPIRVPYAVLAVRQGATVAMFYEFDRPRASGDSPPAVVPEAIVEAQLKKLEASG
ncbi:hypothetical protein [Streptomyces sp. WM6386]|uniref:hypothetical protein n=1 Tax=Streptomyces sp. WM6386 TaxID=1415558 RepID=UPI000619FF17|nr:hypothetical protein [Streptomyces sp. WM6386]KKD05373.1 hypothetical protein TN53_24630 [Streptomyces sp. WM6386]